MADIIEDAMRQYILDDTDVTDIIGTRLFWGKTPQSNSAPYATMITIDDPLNPLWFGTDTISTGQARIQFTCVSTDSFSQAKDVAVKIKNRAQRIQGTIKGMEIHSSIVQGMVQNNDPAIKGFACVVDLIVEYEE